MASLRRFLNDFAWLAFCGPFDTLIFKIWVINIPWLRLSRMWINWRLWTSGWRILTTGCWFMTSWSGCACKCCWTRKNFWKVCNLSTFNVLHSWTLTRTVEPSSSSSSSSRSLYQRSNGRQQDDQLENRWKEEGFSRRQRVSFRKAEPKVFPHWMCPGRCKSWFALSIIFLFVCLAAAACRRVKVVCNECAASTLFKIMVQGWRSCNWR